jgi:hypothetical protein
MSIAERSVELEKLEAWTLGSVRVSVENKSIAKARQQAVLVPTALHARLEL